MNKFLLNTFTLLLFFNWTFGQTTIYQQNFETDFSSNGLLGNTATAGWISSFEPINCGTNYWGVYNTGSYPINGRSLMVTGVDPSCSFYPGQYFTDITDLNDDEVYTTIDATGFEDLIIDFNWKCGGEIFSGVYYDYGNVVYRQGTTGIWQILSVGGNDGFGKYAGQTSTQSESLNLPAILENGIFQLGYRWFQDDNYGNSDAFIIDDIVVKGTPLTSCYGGTASPSFQYTPTNGTANMTLSGHTGTNIQWQVSPNGTTGWTNVSGGTGATTANYTTGSLTTNGTFFYRAVVTDGACSDVSNVIEVVVAEDPVYCSGAGIGNATFNNHLEAIGFHEWIDPTVGGTNNYVTNNYLDYTDTTSYGYATVVAGQYHHLAALLRAQGTGSLSTTFAYWIDWNGDGVFTNTSFASSGERMDNLNYSSNVGNSYAGYFTVPNSVSGMVRVRMRVVAGNQGTLDPCTAYSGAQTKDFMVKVLPSIGNQVCNGVNGTANVISENTTTDKVNISRVLVNGASGTILDNGGGAGYFGIQVGGTLTMYNYSNMMGSYSEGLIFEAGQNYTIQVEHSGYSTAAGLFIDWDGDGLFTGTDELIDVISDALTNPFVFNFTAPASLTDGLQVAMRVRLQYEDNEGDAASMDGCNNLALGLNEYSEVEDYRATLSEATTLPVSWLNVSATCLEKQIQIEWSTATEINNDYFEVYASNNGVDFNIVGKIDGAGNSNEINEYSFTLEKQNNYKYFKIKQTDFDGQYEFSKIVSSNCSNTATEINIYPNPFDGNTFYINYDSEVNDLTIKIYDLTGKLITSPKNVKFENHIEVSLDKHLAKGTYFVELRNSDGFITMKKLMTK